MFNVTKITALPEGMLALSQKAHREGFRFVERLIKDFRSGANRFSAPGEALFEAGDGDMLIGVGGLNGDPYAAGKRIGRLRRVYVDPDYRNEGVGRILVDTIESAAEPHFSALRLFTDSDRAASFYASLGYAEVRDVAHVSHAKTLCSS